MRNIFQDRNFKKAVSLILLCMAVSCIACGKESSKESPTPTETPATEDWWAKVIQQNLSQDMTESSEEEKYFVKPVSVCKTVRLGDFEFSITAPKTIYRLSELQNGTDSIQTTLILRYVGEKESVVISSRDMPFAGLMAADSNRNWESGGSYDIEVHHTLKKGEEISFTKEYDEYSKKTTAAGYGMIAGIVDFTVLDEEGKRTDERYEYLLSVSYDVLG
ncbi:MAG: hypothetical protein J1E35_02090 [Lachnospiraceae bacterium]|nr:hypothetical protein [Lachnospiraceae bacterium]